MLLFPAKDPKLREWSTASKREKLHVTLSAAKAPSPA